MVRLIQSADDLTDAEAQAMVESNFLKTGRPLCEYEGIVGLTWYLDTQPKGSPYARFIARIQERTGTVINEK